MRVRLAWREMHGAVRRARAGGGAGADGETSIWKERERGEPWDRKGLTAVRRRAGLGKARTDPVDALWATRWGVVSGTGRGFVRAEKGRGAVECVKQGGRRGATMGVDGVLHGIMCQNEWACNFLPMRKQPCCPPAPAHSCPPCATCALPAPASSARALTALQPRQRRARGGRRVKLL